MIGTSRRCYSSIKYWNGVLANNSSNNFGHILGLDQPKRNCSGDPKKPDPASCAKNTPQTQGREVEAWPKSDPPPQAWRCECPQDPQPPNYDPYRIRVPEVAVPPLPPNNAKELPNEDRALFNNPEINFGNASAGIRDLFHNSPIVHPDYWKDKPTRRINKTVEDVLPRLGYHGRTKYKYAFHEPWKPLDRLALLAQAEEEESKQSQEAAAVEQSEKQIS